MAHSGPAFYSLPTPPPMEEPVTELPVQENIPEQITPDVVVDNNNSEPITSESFEPLVMSDTAIKNTEQIETPAAVVEEQPLTVPADTFFQENDGKLIPIVTPEKTEEIEVTSPITTDKKKPGMFGNTRERNAFIFFMVPIMIMSFVSMLHLVDFFSIGNNTITAWLLAIAFEMASLSTIVALVLLRKLKKPTLWSILVLLYALQLLGNIYAPFDFIKPDAGHRLFEFFGLAPSEISAQRIVAVIQGAILPTVVILLFKMTSNYLSTTEEDPGN